MHAPSLPPYLQLELWTTPGADTVSEGFSYKALVREPEAREHRKRIIGASRIRRAIRPIQVLLFGVTTLRIT